MSKGRHRLESARLSAWLSGPWRAVRQDRGVVLAEDLDTSTLTARQQRILAAIRDWVVRYGYAPSTREIGDAVGLASDKLYFEIRVENRPEDPLSWLR